MLLYKDCKGMIFSTDLLLTLLLLVLVFGIVANIIDSSNERIINPLEMAELERLSNEVVDNLINNPGTPFHWEELFNFARVIPGLAIENNDSEAIINTVSFKKIKIIENDYNDLIDEKMFNGEIKSSIGLYPINCNIDSFVIGDDILINDNIFSLNPNISNIVAVNRMVKCDFYRDLAIVSVDDGQLSEISQFSDNSSVLEKNGNICNHETINNLKHFDNGTYRWVCKEFKITRNNFEKNDYYLFFSDNSVNNGNYWILDDIISISTYENSINSEKISLNNYLNDVFKNNSSMIFYLHYKINKNKFNDFNGVLVGIPKNTDINSLNIDYFREQDCNLIMRTYYK